MTYYTWVLAELLGFSGIRRTREGMTPTRLRITFALYVKKICIS